MILHTTLALVVLGQPGQAMGKAQSELPGRSQDVERALEGPGEQWTVERAIAAAVGTSPRVDAELLERDQADAERRVARAAALPRVNLSAQYVRLNEIENSPLVAVGLDIDAARAGLEQVADPAARTLIGGQLDALAEAGNLAIEVPRNRTSLRAELAYPVSQLFLEILPAIRARGRATEARELELEVTRNAVALDTVRAFYSHGRARSALAVADVSVRRAERDLKQAEARLRTAVGNRPDVLRFQARLAEAEAERAEREADVIASASQLRTLLHLDGDGLIAFADSLVEAPPLDQTILARSLDEAWATRDELAALELLQRSQEHAANAARNSALPKLQFAAGIDYSDPNPLFVPPPDGFRTSYTVGGILSWSPDDSYAATQRAEGADLAAKRIAAQRLAIRDRIRAEYARARARYVSAFQVFRAAERQSAAAEEAYAARLEGYRVGLFDATSLIDSELDANRARLALVDAGTEIRIRRFALARAAGVDIWK